MRLAVVSDIHGNLPALEAVIQDLGRRGADAVVNLGDAGDRITGRALRHSGKVGWAMDPGADRGAL